MSFANHLKYRMPDMCNDVMIRTFEIMRLYEINAVLTKIFGKILLAFLELLKALGSILYNKIFQNF